MSSNNLEHINNNLCLKTRTLILIGDVNEELLLNLIRGVTTLVSASSEKPITIYLTTDGGCVYTSVGMYDFLISQPCHINIVCVGYVFSAGTIILQAGDTKSAYKHTRFMIHEIVSETNSSGVSNHKRLIKELESISSIYKNIYNFKSLPQHDKYYSAEEMIEIGLLDNIL